MSLMSRAGILGAISGAAGTYNQIQSEQRKQDATFEQQDRQNALAEKRAARLREFRIKLAQENNASAEKRNSDSIAAQQAIARQKIKADQGKPIAVSSGTDVIDASGNVIYQNDDRQSGTGAGRGGRGTPIGGKTDFFQLSKYAFADNPESGIRATAAAEKLAQKYPEMGGKQIYLAASRFVRDNPALSAEQVKEKLDAEFDGNSPTDFFNPAPRDKYEQRIVDLMNQGSDVNVPDSYVASMGRKQQQPIPVPPEAANDPAMLYAFFEQRHDPETAQKLVQKRFPSFQASNAPASKGLMKKKPKGNVLNFAPIDEGSLGSFKRGDYLTWQKQGFDVLPWLQALQQSGLGMADRQAVDAAIQRLQ